MIAPALDQAPQLHLELLLGLGGLVVAGGHVLPDQQAELVAPVIPAVRLDLDVLAGAS